MNLTQLTSADLKQIVKLLEQKETLQSRVAKIDAALRFGECDGPDGGSFESKLRVLSFPQKATKRTKKRGIGAP